MLQRALLRAASLRFSLDRQGPKEQAPVLCPKAHGPHIRTVGASSS